MTYTRGPRPRIGRQHITRIGIILGNVYAMAETDRERLLVALIAEYVGETYADSIPDRWNQEKWDRITKEDHR